MLLHLAVAFTLLRGPLVVSHSAHDDFVDLTLSDTLISGGVVRKPAPKVAAPPQATSGAVEKTVNNESLSADTATTATEAGSGSATNSGAEGLGAGEEAVGWSQVTRLPKVLKEVKATYPEEAKQARIDGPVNLEILIDRTGKVREVKMLNGPGYGLDESAIAAVKQFEFQPAQKGSDAVAVKIRYTYRFKLGVN